VAIEKLTEALNLAEPGGIIRLFVDLGPKMADLLKQLIKQNIAVDYAGQILSAFSENAQRVVPGASNHESPSPHLQRSSSSSYSAFPPGPLPARRVIGHGLTGRRVGPYGPYGFRLVDRAYSSERPEAAFPIPPSTPPSPWSSP
jgi:LuxR family maltose regulon positive regulatory protein